MREKKLKKLTEKVEELNLIEFAKLFKNYIRNGGVTYSSKFSKEDFMNYLAVQILDNYNNVSYFSIQNLIIKMVNNEIKDTFKLISFNSPTNEEYDFIKKWCWGNHYICNINYEPDYLDIEVVKGKEEEEKC